MGPALAITLVILLLTGAALIILDIVAARNGGYTATISYQTYRWSRANPIVPFIAGLIAGILAGHFWWPQFHE